MKRPLLFALEVVAAMLLASAGAWVLDRVNHKANRQAQAQERSAQAEERIAAALEIRPAATVCSETCAPDLKDSVAAKPLNLPGWNH